MLRRCPSIDPEACESCGSPVVDRRLVSATPRGWWGGAVAYPGARLTPWLMTDPGGHDVCVSEADDRLVTVAIAVITASSRLVTDAKVCSSLTHTLSALQAR